jgi:hypothetical protein
MKEDNKMEVTQRAYVENGRRRAKVNPATDVFLYCQDALKLNPRNEEVASELKRIRSFCMGLIQARVDRHEAERDAERMACHE